MYVKRKLASYVRLREEASEQGSEARRVDDYLQALLEAERRRAKPALKAALSSFHHIAPLVATDPFLLSLLCVAVPLPSDVVAKKVLSNACAIPAPDVSVAIVELLLRRISDRCDTCKQCRALLLGLIERGLGGKAADVKKSLRMLKAMENAAPHDGLEAFVSRVGQTIVQQQEADAETLALYCECVEVLGDDCGKRLCDALVVAATAGSEQVTLQCLRLLLLLTRDHAARILHCLYSLLNLVLTACARHNHVAALHVAALQLYAEVLPLVGLEADGASSAEAEAKAQYLAYMHREGDRTS